MPISGLKLLVVLIAAALVSAALIVLMRPLLIRYALARPNARSSHREPTPQGGGIAVISATVLVMGGLFLTAPAAIGGTLHLSVLFAATIGLAIVGATDDVRPMEAIPRLILQAIAVAVVIAALPGNLRAVPELPWWLERAGLLVGGVWFVNLVNFMDGIDWITVVEVVPMSAALVVFGLTGALPPAAAFVAMALCGGMIGFALFNRPVARLFLGDVGSLPVGLLLMWLLILLAGSGHLAAALLLPLYYLADSTVTLLRRLANGEPVMAAHRSHFYQRAIDNGFSVPDVLVRVFTVNLSLIGFAAATVVSAEPILHAVAIAAGCIIVGLLLARLSRKKQ